MNCPRIGGTNLTLIGNYLGLGPSRVQIGSAQCTHVLHDPVTPDTKLTCLSPPGVSLAESILFIQYLGEYSLDLLTVSYTQCTPGRYSTGSTYCTACDVGALAVLLLASSKRWFRCTQVGTAR